MGRRLTLLAALAVALAAAGCGGGEREREEPRTVERPAGRVLSATDATFERTVESAGGPVLVVFWARWSRPDRIVLAYLGDIARERPGLRVVRVDVDRAARVAAAHGVLSIPTAMVLVDGEVRGRPVVGAYPRERFERELGLDEVAPRG